MECPETPRRCQSKYQAIINQIKFLENLRYTVKYTDNKVPGMSDFGLL